MPKITPQFVENIVPDPKRALTIYWDSELKGFGVVVLLSGRRTYCIQYRNQERIVRRYKIGIHGHITTEEARSMAQQKLSQVAHGEDPAEQRKKTLYLSSMEDLAKNYLDYHCCNKSRETLQKDKELLQNIILPALGPLKVRDIAQKDIVVLHKKLKKMPFQANRILALLSKMFTLAVAWRWKNNNPVLGIEKYPEEKPERWLNEEELTRLWTTLDSHSDHLAAYVLKLLILTGARKSEVLQATWNQFDLEKRIWTKPSHLTRQQKEERLLLSEKALEVLQSLKKLTPEGSLHIFTNPIKNEPIKEIKVFWKEVLEAAKLENVRIQDLRHIYVSRLPAD